MRTYRRGNFAIYLSQEYCFYETDSPDIFELIDRRYQYEKLKEIGFSQYNKAISYKHVSKKEISSAFNATTFVKHKGFNFFVENASEDGFVLRPLEDAMKYLKDFPRHGYDPIYEATEEEISDIWEERRPIEGFKFNVKPIAYLKKRWELVGGGVKQGHQVPSFKNSGGIIRFKSKDIPENTVIPKGGIFNDWNYPFTSHGFTAEIKERTEVPEFTQKKINSRPRQKLRFEIPKAEFFKRIA